MFGEPRTISREEVEVIRAAFVQGQPLRDVSPAAFESLPSLTVVARCPCGCASVDFAERAQGGPRPTLLADAVATNSDGTRVGVMVWGSSDAITALEVYDVEGGHGNMRLPEPASIQSYFPTD